MSVLLQQTTHTMMAHFHLRLEQQQYTLTVNIIGFELDHPKKKREIM